MLRMLEHPEARFDSGSAYQLFDVMMAVDACTKISTLVFMPPVLSVHFHKTPTGNEPVRDWLKALDRPTKLVIGGDIKTVEFGWPLGMPLVRKMDKNLWEIRSDIPAGIARVLFTVAGSKLVLLHGFIKKSDKTPKSDLDLAKSRRDEVKKNEQT